MGFDTHNQIILVRQIACVEERKHVGYIVVVHRAHLRQHVQANAYKDTYAMGQARRYSENPIWYDSKAKAQANGLQEPQIP